MSAYIDDKKLREALEMVVAKLREKGCLPEPVDVENIVDSIMKNMHDNKLGDNELNLSDPKDHQAFVKTLVSLVVNAEIGAKQPHLKLDLSKFLADLSHLDPQQKKELKEGLAQLIELRLKYINQFTPKPSGPEVIKKIAADIADAFVNKHEKQAPGMQQDTASFLQNLIVASVAANTLESDSLRSLFGGIVPSIAGGIAAPVEFIRGNLAGFMNQTQGLAGSAGFMDEQNRYDAGADPLGEEANVLTNIISEGTLIPDIIDDLQHANIIGKSNTPKFEPHTK